MNSSKKILNRLLIVNLGYWLAISLVIIIIETLRNYSIDGKNLTLIFTFPVFFIVPLSIINLRFYYRDKNKSVFFENEQIIITKNEKKLIIRKEDIKKIKLYDRAFFSDIIIDLNYNVRFCISNSHNDYKETLNKLRSWDILIRYS
jgi:hypothetical protein